MNTKRLFAVALSATMVFGSTLTAFATEPDTTAATGSGAGTGAGTTEGYVDTLKTKVILPIEETINEGISFRVDPQRLIAGTQKAAHPDWTLPESNDTGVYFMTGDKTYANTSNEFYVANIGTGDVTFTIKVEAVATETPTTDIPFDTKENVEDEDATAAALYIGAKIGKGATAEAVTSSAITKKVILEGVPDNYEYVYDASNETKPYDYVIKDDTDAETKNMWNAVPISFEGSITNIATDKTIPGIKVTYSWAAKAEGDAEAAAVDGVTVEDKYVAEVAPAATGYISAAGVSATSKAVTFAAGEGVTVSSVKLTLNGSDIVLASGNHYSVTGNTITITKYADGWAGGTITVTFSDGQTDTLVCE